MLKFEQTVKNSPAKLKNHLNGDLFQKQNSKQLADFFYVCTRLTGMH